MTSFRVLIENSCLGHREYGISAHNATESCLFASLSILLTLRPLVASKSRRCVFGSHNGIGLKESSLQLDLNSSRMVQRMTSSSGSLKREQMLLRDAEAPHYERSFSLYDWAAEKEAVRTCMNQCTPGRVLDAGGGIGVYAGKALARGTEVVVVDFSIRALEVNRAKNSNFRANLELVLADVVRLPFRDEAFQNCLFFGVLQYMESDDMTEALLESRRILQPQGTLCMSVYNYSLLSRLRGDRQGWHRTAYPRLGYRRFTYGELRKMLLPNFHVIRIRGYENLAYLDRLWELAIRMLGSFVVVFDSTLSQVIPLSLLISENLLVFAEPRFRRRSGAYERQRAHL
jgi:ubiquinone/menaquinone biosynthesis C-methylase UbiE